jgi:hypothetical protein
MKKNIKEDEEVPIEARHIKMGIPTMIAIAFFIISTTWGASILWNNDRDHEDKQDHKTAHIAERDSAYFLKLENNQEYLKQAHVRDSIRSEEMFKKVNKMIPLLDTIIRGQKKGLNTTLNLLRELYTDKEYLDTSQKKKRFCLLTKQLENQL